MNTKNDETIYINYREKVPCFGSNPSADIKLMNKLRKQHAINGICMLGNAIFLGFPIVISIISIIAYILSL